MNCLLIMNQNANKGKSVQIHQEIEKAFQNTKHDYVMRQTADANDARKFAYEAVGKYDVIVACGGDGTVNETVDGMLKRCEELELDIQDRPKLAIFPIGRGNDFAWMMDIDGDDIEHIVSNITNNKHKVIDAGWCRGGRFPDGAFFINGLGIGFEPTVNYNAGKYKNVSGSMSYIMALFHTLVHYPLAMNITIKNEDGTSEKVSSQQLSIGNGRRMGSSFLMSPKAIVDDGLLDFVYAYRPISRRVILLVALKFFKGKQIEDSHFKMRRIKSLMIESELNNMVAHIDGEMIGTTLNHLEIKVRERAIAIIC
ncbi:MAG: diacylglycerol/lipid kinase family protein [Sphaerochaeta sp.]